MKTFIEQAHLYSQYHQKRSTLITHLIGIPLIIFAGMIFLGFFHLIIPGWLDTTLAGIGTFVLWVYYLRLNWRLSVLILPVLILMLWLSMLISHDGPTRFALWFFLSCFIIGWIFQFIGHLLEGNNPLLFNEPRQALIAPLYLVAEICFMAGRMQGLKDALHGNDEKKKEA